MRREPEGTGDEGALAGVPAAVAPDVPPLSEVPLDRFDRPGAIERAEVRVRGRMSDLRSLTPQSLDVPVDLSGVRDVGDRLPGVLGRPGWSRNSRIR